MHSPVIHMWPTFLMEQEGHTPTEILLKSKEDSTKKLSYSKKNRLTKSSENRAMILIQVPNILIQVPNSS
jgi:hypothetical protein